MLSTRTMAVVIVIAFLVIVGGLFVVSFRFSVFCVYNALTDSTMLVMGTSEFYQRHQEAVDLLDYTFYGIVLPGVFISVVITSTIITSLKLKRIADWRASSTSSSAATSSSAREVALTRMLISTSCLFIACFLPNFFFRITCLFVEDLKTGKRYHNMYYVMLWLLDMASFVNSSVNFFVYYYMGSRYREVFWEILAKCKIRIHKNAKATEERSGASGRDTSICIVPGGL